MLGWAGKGCCCDDDPTNTPCCGATAWGTGGADTPGIIPTTLYLSDGLGTVTLTYNGPRPVSAHPGEDNIWWGCTTRSTTTGRTRNVSGDCDPGDITIDVEILFAFYCRGSNGFRLEAYHMGCGYADNGIDVQNHMRVADNGCTGPWPATYTHTLAGASGVAPADCAPFSWGPHSLSFPATPYPASPLRGVYGGTGSWTVSE